MSVISVTERYDERQAMQDLQADTATRVFNVLCDDWDDGTEVAYAATGIPRIGDQHPQTTFKRCVRVNAEPIDGDFRFFKVTCDYSSLNVEGVVENPLMRPQSRQWYFEKTREPVERCTFIDDGNLYGGGAGTEYPNIIPASSTGVPFTTPLERDQTRLNLRIIRNELTYDVNLAMAYADAVNSDGWMGVQREQAKCNYIAGTPQFESGIRYFAVEYDFSFREETWNVWVADRALSRAITDPTTHEIVDVKALVDADDVPFSEPQRLDGRGGLLKAWLPSVFFRYRIYPKLMPFRSLGLE